MISRINLLGRYAGLNNFSILINSLFESIITGPKTALRLIEQKIERGDSILKQKAAQWLSE